MDVRRFRRYLKSCSGPAEYLRRLCLIICPCSGLVAVIALRYCLILFLSLKPSPATPTRRHLSPHETLELQLMYYVFYYLYFAAHVAV